MALSQKCQYGLRALLELSKRSSADPVRLADIAGAQAIPERFLENILNELRKGGFVGSRRGPAGGFVLFREPAELSVGEVIRFLQGPVGPVDCSAGGGADGCPFRGACAFKPMWERVEQAVNEVYDSTTFADLVAEDRAQRSAPDFSI